MVASQARGCFVTGSMPFHGGLIRATTGTKARLADGAEIAVTRRALPLAADRERMASTRSELAGSGGAEVLVDEPAEAITALDRAGGEGNHIGRWLGDTLVEPLMGPGLVVVVEELTRAWLCHKISRRMSSPGVPGRGAG